MEESENAENKKALIESAPMALGERESAGTGGPLGLEHGEERHRLLHVGLQLTAAPRVGARG